MPAKHLVGLARFCVSGTHRHELTSVALEAETVCRNHPHVLDIVHLPISRFPTNVARNEVVRVAREQHVDILFMVDEDMKPAEGFFRHALDFLLNYEGPAAIASPYCTAPPLENVNVFEWAKGAQSIAAPFATVCVVREDAARRTGNEMVINAGTGYVAYKMSCFDAVEKVYPNTPFYDYSCSDYRKTRIVETEDCWFHRLCYFASVPMWVSWDHWSDHYKLVPVQRPYRMTDTNVGNVFMQQARAEVRWGGEKLAKMIPQDIEGWCDFGEVYADAVNRTPEQGQMIEVGSYKGQSAILMARLIKNSGKKHKFMAVDNFKGSPEHHASNLKCDNLKEEFDANLKKHGVWNDVELAIGDSVYVAKCFDDRSVDFVFLDASHDYESVCADIRAWLPKIKHGGILAGHDYDNFSVSKAVADMLNEARTITISGRSWIYRVPATGPCKLPDEGSGKFVEIPKESMPAPDHHGECAGETPRECAGDCEGNHDAAARERYLLPLHPGSPRSWTEESVEEIVRRELAKVMREKVTEIHKDEEREILFGEGSDTTIKTTGKTLDPQQWASLSPADVTGLSNALPIVPDEPVRSPRGDSKGATDRLDALNKSARDLQSFAEALCDKPTPLVLDACVTQDDVERATNLARARKVIAERRKTEMAEAFDPGS